jgi:RNA polymerase sigma-70 factor (ECF subfamily)
MAARTVTIGERMSREPASRVPERVRDSHATEGPIVQGLRRGDRAAFDAAYARYRGRLYAFLLRLSGRRDVAEDLFQETWLKLARSAHRLAEDTDLGAWLFAVARNAWVSHRRWTVLDVSRLMALGDESRPALHAVPAGPDLEARTDAARRLAELETALAELSPKLREVVLLVGIEGFDPDRAAAILGIRPDALRQRLARARAQLAARLDPMHSAEEAPA